MWSLPLGLLRVSKIGILDVSVHREPQLRALLPLPAVGALVNGNDALRSIAHEGEQGGVFGFHVLLARVKNRLS